jgi:8-oxo-dGTP diphosphatase
MAPTSKRPVVGVMAIVRRGENLLLVQRTQAATIGRWGFPGGHLEFGETLIEGAMRELFEETAVEAEPVAMLPAFEYIRDESHYVIVPILAEWKAGDGTAGDDAGAVQWTTVAELETGNLPILDNVVDLARLAFST